MSNDQNASDQQTDLQQYPLEKEAHDYLTATADGRDTPRRFDTRWSDLVDAAEFLGRQLTLEEIQAIISEDEEMSCGHPQHGDEHAFTGVSRLVLDSDNPVEDPEPVEGIPESILPIVRRHPDGAPVRVGSVALRPIEEFEGEGGWTNAIFTSERWAAVPLCGERYFLPPRDKDEAPVEVVNNRSHLGMTVRADLQNDNRGYTYTASGAEKVAEIREEKARKRESAREEDYDAQETVRRIMDQI